MLARAFAAAEPGVRVFSCHPGIADSSVARGLGASFEKGDAAARAGAATPLFVATMPLEGTTSGTFWSDRRMWGIAHSFATLSRWRRWPSSSRATTVLRKRRPHPRRRCPRRAQGAQEEEGEEE